MNESKKQVTKADVVRIMLCALIGLFLLGTIITEYCRKKEEYKISFQVGEQIGKVVSIIEVGRLEDNINDNGGYLEAMVKANRMINELTEENIDAFLEAALPLAGVEISNHFDLITNEEAFWDGYYMRAFDKSIVFARITEYITEEQAQDLFAMRDEVCEKPTHKKVLKYYKLILKFFFSSEEANN